MAIDPAPAPPTSTDAQAFRFTGSAREYFGIWIVNLFLSIVTLGIYSAWAKVRKKRYFYGNTWVGDANFEYHGRPLAILKGRLIAFVAFAAYTALARYTPKGAAAFLLAAAPVVPWLILRSFAFNATNSSYRNVRFAFEGRYRDAFFAIAPFIAVAILSVLTPQPEPGSRPSTGEIALLFVPTLVALAAYPYALAKLKLLAVNGSSFGTARFSSSATVRRFYGIYFVAMLLFVVAVVALGAVAGLLFPVSVWLATIALALTYVFSMALALGFTRSQVANLVFNTTSLEGGASFESRLETLRLARLYAGNLFAIMLTVGLAVPWAAVRTARYRAECLALHAPGGLDEFVAQVTREVTATGEEVGQMFDVDLSL